MTLAYKELTKLISIGSKYTQKEVRLFMLHLLREVLGALEEGRDVDLEGIGKFLNLPQKELIVRNRDTREITVIPPTRRLKFIPAPPILRAVKASKHVYEQTNPIEKYGLMEKIDGKIWSTNRSKESRKRETSWQRRKS